MKILILTEKKTITSVEVMVAGERNAKQLARDAKADGFEKVKVHQQPGVKGTPLYHVMIWKKTGGKVSEITSFLKAHPNVEFYKRASR